MKDNKPKFIEGIGWRYETIHSMHRRMQGHDYYGRCIYMITMATEGRKPVLGNLRWPKGRPEDAYVEPTELGREVGLCWLAIEHYYPGVMPLALQIMPDHIHGLLFITREQAAHLGKIVNGFKVGCNKAFRKLMGNAEAMPQTTGQQQHAVAITPQQVGQQQHAVAITPQQVGQQQHAVAMTPRQAMATRQAGQGAPQQAVVPQQIKLKQCPKHPEHGLLFETGYQDSILMSKGQLDRMFQYIADNPRRLAVKREKPELFRVVRQLIVPVFEASPLTSATVKPAQQAQPAMTFAAIGNMWLLERPVRMQVRCHNNHSEENLTLIQKQKAYFLDRGKKEGAVIVSPCISAGEKEIARAALDAGVPLVVILENGFPPMYKPPGKYFEACAQGLLLMLAPWPYHMEKRTITRQQCLALNDMALRLSTEPWTLEMEGKLVATSL